MQEVDANFTMIKEAESIDSIEDIVGVLKRYHEKCNEMYSKLYIMTNEIDQLEHTIEENTEYVMKALEFNSKLIQQKKEENDQKVIKAEKLKETQEE